MDRYQTRRQKLRQALARAKAEALLVTNFVNVTYLTGFTGDDSYLLVRRDGEVILSDPRYTTQLEEECPGVELYIRPPGVQMLQGVVQIVRAAEIQRLAVEGDSMPVSLWNQLAEKLPQVAIGATSGMVEHLRMVKDKEEVARIREAARLAERAFAVVRATLRPEMTEKEVADELDHQMRLFGGKCASFPSIVAVGPRAALPHATPGQRKVHESNLLLIDWGADLGLYKSDLTRVLITGKISPKLRRVYEVVLDAQTRAIAAIRPGVPCHEVDAVARQTIAKAGFGRRFGHGLGHGLGLEVHEAPRLARKIQTVLRPGMVVTVEPGIYIPGWGGVRIEDDVVVTCDGYEVLTSAPKKLDEMIVA
jgi:Xaa-Pro aminopeptidase